MSKEHQVSSGQMLSLKEVIILVNEIRIYLFSKWLRIVIAGLIGAFIGLFVALRQPAIYEAKISFVLEEESKSGGGLAGIASSFGFGNFVSSGGGIFSSANFLEFLKSRSLIEKTLLAPYNESKKITFAQKFAQMHEWDKTWATSKKKEIKRLKFLPNEPREKFSIEKDSILGSMYLIIRDTEMKAEQPDEDKSIMELTMKSKDQVFAKEFSEKLLEIAADFYTKTKTKKAQKNVDILQRQTDSVRLELFKSLSGAAIADDQIFGLNPSMNAQRVPSAKKQIDIQANSAVLAELVKNLELTKMNLLNQTPLLEVVDKPILPLKKMKLGKFKAVLIGGFLLAFLTIAYLIVVRYIRKVMVKE